MNEADYQKVLQHLEGASSVLRAQEGQLGEADIRVRQLVNIAISDTKRCLRLAQVPPPRSPSTVERMSAADAAARGPFG